MEFRMALWKSWAVEVVNVDIDPTVADVAKRFFPHVAAGFNDSRCELLHADAFAWAPHFSIVFNRFK